MRELLAVTNALADENRVRALLALRAAPAGELCVCQIVELLGLAPSTVSKHLFLLKSAGLVDARKQGRWMYYRTADDDDAPPAARAALRWVADSLADDRRVADDRRRLDEILQCDPEALCKQQAGRPGAAAAADSKCCSSAPATLAAAKWPRGGRGGSRATVSKPSQRAPTRTA